MRTSSWTDDATNNNSGSQSFPISHWELPGSKAVDEDLCYQRLSDWKFFSQTLLESGSEVTSSRSRDRDSLSSSGSRPSFSNDSDLCTSSLLSKQSSTNSSSSSTSSFKESSCPLSSKGDRYKTELCRPFEEYGACKYGDKCQFAHGKDEIRVVVRHPKYKTDKCRTFYTTGFCPYGQRCHFVHDQQPAKADCNKISKNTIGLIEQQQIVLARQQQLRNLTLLQQIQYQQQVQRQAQQLAIPIPQRRTPNNSSTDQLVEVLKQMLTISSATSTDSVATGFRPATLPIDDFRSQPISVRPTSPIKNLWGGSVGSTTASSPTKSLPSSTFSPSPSPTSPFELCDGAISECSSLQSMGYEPTADWVSIQRWSVPMPNTSTVKPSNIWSPLL